MAIAATKEVSVATTEQTSSRKVCFNGQVNSVSGSFFVVLFAVLFAVGPVVRRRLLVVG